MKFMSSQTLCAYLDRSLSSINRDVEKGRLPPPIKLGRNRYWSREEIEAALELQRNAPEKGNPGEATDAT